MLKITNLNDSKALDSKAMAGIRGGNSPLEILGALLDLSTSLNSKTADVNQGFGFGLEQNNAGAVTNNQIIHGGNGIVYAPVNQSLSQSSWMDVFGIGNSAVS